MALEPRGEYAYQDESSVLESSYPLGMLPPPGVLRQYEALIPGSAERLIRLAEDEGQRRHQLELARLRGEALRAVLGICFGATLALILVAGGIVVTLTGDREGAAGAPFLVFGITLLIGVLFFAHAQRHAESSESQPMPPRATERVGRAYDPQGFEL